MTFLYYILFVYLKSFKDPASFAKAVAKVRRIFLTSKFFRRFFEKIFQRVSIVCKQQWKFRPRIPGLSFLAPLPPCKVRYSVQRLTSALRLHCVSLRFASLPRFSLESGCKGTHFSEFRKPHAENFSRFFCNRIVTRWKAGI